LATSGLYTFNRTRNQIINSGLRKVGAVADGENPEPQQLSDAVEALEMLIQALGNQVFPFWAIEWKTHVLVASSEVVGTDGENYTCIRPHTAADANRPVTGGDYTTYWTIRGSSGVAWVAGTAKVAINVFEPGTEILSISKAFYRRTEIDHPMRIITRDQYFELASDKKRLSVPQNLIFIPNLTPEIWIDPIPNKSTDVIHYLAWRRLQDFNAEGNTPDARQQWLKYLVWQLAADLAPEYGVPPQKEASLERKAATLLQFAKRNNALPKTSSRVVPAYGGGGSGQRRRI